MRGGQGVVTGAIFSALSQRALAMLAEEDGDPCSDVEASWKQISIHKRR